MKLLVTGALGFIGSHFLRHVLDQDRDVTIRAFARCSSQRNLRRLGGLESELGRRLELVYGDLFGDVSGLLQGVDVVVHFAARTFVDHSIKDPAGFMRSNVQGTFNLLEQARLYKPKLWVQISTDEVYGEVLVGASKETDPLNPANPYAASKASADLWVQSFGNTYGLPYLITRTENNYGPYQHPEKAIPTWIRAALSNRPLPIYGDGRQIRTWIRAEDHCAAVWHLIQHKLDDPDVRSGIFHIATGEELTNLTLAERICDALGKVAQLQFLPDKDFRPGHDRRYTLDASKLRATGWAPRYTLEGGLEQTVAWYQAHPEWVA